MGDIFERTSGGYVYGKGARDYSDYRPSAAALKHAKSSRQPVVITQRGRATAVLLSMEAYERGEHERQLLHLLARGDQEIAAGRGFSLDEVLAEADALLAGGPK